jgi:hypothetical protein
MCTFLGDVIMELALNMQLMCLMQILEPIGCLRLPIIQNGYQ